MRYDTNRARLESEIARAHRAVFNASQAAMDCNDPAAAEELDSILRELTRLGNDSLRTSKRQLRPVDPGARQTA